jgi:NTE family protein
MNDPASSLHTILAESSVFSVIPVEALAAVADGFQPQWVDDGAYLFHADQTADRLYVVAQGLLEVVRSSGEPTVLLNVVGVGQVVGELAVLRGALRSASVRARGRALVYWMHAADFMALVYRWPALAIDLARRVATDFVRSEQRFATRERPPTWCVHSSLPLDFVEALLWAAAGRPSAASPRRAAVLLREPGSAPRGRDGLTIEAVPIDPDPEARLRRLGEEAQRSDLVVVYGELADLEWVLPVADALVTGPDAGRLASPASIRRLQLVRTGIPTRDRIKARIDAPLSSVAPRLARILQGRSVGLALGGGGALGLAHLGVLEVLDELGVEIDYVLGTSMGAIVGAAYVCVGVAGMRRWLETLVRPVDWLGLVDPGVFTSGVLSGRRVMRRLAEILELERFDQLHTPFATVALDIDASEERVLREGSLVDAVRASMAIPGVFTPHRYESPFGSDARYVDGGMINNVPVDCVRAMGADRVIGVHVMSRDVRAGSGPPSRLRWPRRLPGLGGLDRLHTAAQTYVVALARSGERQVFQADVGILPDTHGISLYEFWRGRELAERGRQATRRVEDQLRLLAGHREATPAGG